MQHSYSDIPLPKSPYGEAMYQAGRHLVTEAGTRLDELIWDADEVLWDWVIDLPSMLRSPYRLVVRGDFSHREYFRLKPGIVELIAGMHHASKEIGVDPYMRVWTDGYPWRTWRIAAEVPALQALFGPPADPTALVEQSFADHPRLFHRVDYANETRKLLSIEQRALAMASWPSKAREAMEHQLAATPCDSTLKIPELALLAGKTGFERSSTLIDDQSKNIERFVASGRSGLHLAVEPPWILFGHVPNAAWASPYSVLAQSSTKVAEELAGALARLAGTAPGTIVIARSTTPVGEYRFHDFAIDIPDAVVRAEWLDPMRSLKRAAKQTRKLGIRG